MNFDTIIYRQLKTNAQHRCHAEMAACAMREEVRTGSGREVEEIREREYAREEGGEISSGREKIKVRVDADSLSFE
jgi:hypothetical protein